jgi:hypothetical protein
MPNRKLIFKAACLGCVIFWISGVVTNHGLGRIRVQSGWMIVSEVGFLGCWVAGAGSAIPTAALHRAAFRRLAATRSRRQASGQSKMRSFRLPTSGWRGRD